MSIFSSPTSCEDEFKLKFIICERWVLLVATLHANEMNGSLRRKAGMRLLLCSSGGEDEWQPLIRRRLTARLRLCGATQRSNFRRSEIRTYSVIFLHYVHAVFSLEIIKSNWLSGAGLVSLWMGEVIIYPLNGPNLRTIPHTQLMH